MKRLDVPFDTEPAGIDESRIGEESPFEMAHRLARQKVRVIGAANPSTFVIGSDQVIALGSRIFRKPKTVQRAIAQLQSLQGNTHRLITAVSLHRPGGQIDAASATYEMEMRELTKRQIKRYVEADQPLNCAGSYRIEAAGIKLFEATRGDDPTAIEGLALTRVWSLLLAAGWTDE